MYRSLNDAAKINPLFGLGSKVKVWYMKPDSFRNFSDGIHRGISYGYKFDPKNLEATHTLLGECSGGPFVNCGDVAFQLQGEIWSPNGEARSLIESKDLSHTSFSHGDIIQIDDELFTLEGFQMVQL
jgi:hypothetical protein